MPRHDGHPTGPPRGASPRQVRFHEAKSLITSTRGPNNCRDYSEAALGRVQQIRELLNAGLSTQAIRPILPVRRRCCRTENGDRADRHHTIARFTPVSNAGEITAPGGSLRALLELGQVVGDRVTVAGQDVDALGQVKDRQKIPGGTSGRLWVPTIN
ncbi:MerR family transcriptional regulator [Streptomyces sp. NPDC005209]|uniref:MerR family transcriptional regulator n=1 Tax=Streptomyces sp. NPDC005209 TaxID=3156715 RepID=UPI0033A32C90